MTFYQYITQKRQDSESLKSIMEAVSKDLQECKTDELKPGVLLGLIQSGKTRAFIGVIADCFDKGFDVAIVFTKNSVALAQQTITRLKSEFEMPIERNRLYLWDIIRLQNPEQLTGYVLSFKNIIVVKKETKNLEKLLSFFEKTELKNKNILIIDDEADQASVSFLPDKTKEEGIDFAKIAGKISDFRSHLKGKSSFLQVTATPYSLYLQPEEMAINGNEYAPLRPTFTHILNPHPYYVGGKFYFEDSLVSGSPASYIHSLVSIEELGLLNARLKTKTSYNKKILDNILKTPSLEMFRFSILAFLVGGAIRQLQENSLDAWAKPYHCAFVMHTSTTKNIHKMQVDLVARLMDQLLNLKFNELQELLENPYHNLAQSVSSSGLSVSPLNDVVSAVYNALSNNHIGVVVVNSENQVAELLGDDGQLRLDNPFNIFVGGQSLDRGVTIDHLIGFFYGRNPSTFQMDTVLQHSRMYGSRSKEDLAVTRFYTSARIYEAMRNMHWFDKDLRENIGKDPTTATARFIAKQGNTIIPAGPNKLRASGLKSFRAHSLFLPIGFQTRSHTSIKLTIEEIDSIVRKHKDSSDGKSHFALNKQTTIDIIEKIRTTFAYEDRFNNRGLEWDVAPVTKALEIALDKNNTEEVFIYFQENRQAGRLKNEGNSFGDAPMDGRTDVPYCREIAANRPVLMLLKQQGNESDGWRNAPFYWPVLMMPANMPNYVYCEE
jgi:hypothetical protein